MTPVQAVARTFGIGAICVALTACYFPDRPDIGDAKIAAELAPSLDALREAVPEHHRRLADGTFDSLWLLEQWDFVAEIREIVRKQRKAELAESRAAWRQSRVESLDSTKTLSPESAEQLLAFEREMLLRHLKIESDQVAMEDRAGWIQRQLVPEDR